MNKEEIKKLIKTYGGFANKPELQIILNDYLKSTFLEKIKGTKLEKLFYRIYTTDKRTDAHFLQVKLHLDYYKSKKDYDNYHTNYSYSVNVEEHFGNCGLVCINNMTDVYWLDDNELFVSSLMQVAEELAEMYNYSSIIYTLSSNQGKHLSEYLSSNYKVIHEFKNKRMSTQIKVYSKDI